MTMMNKRITIEDSIEEQFETLEEDLLIHDN